MTRLNVIIAVVTFFSLVMEAQQMPDWYDMDKRRFLYPSTEYFTGFAVGSRMADETVEAAMLRLKNEARVEALSSIQVQVENTTKDYSSAQQLQTMDGWIESVYLSLESTTRLQVKMEIPGLQIEAWNNPANNEITAFAYVRKSTLVRQMEKQIISGLIKIETALDNAQQLADNSQKVQARSIAENVVPCFADVEQAQRILVAVDLSADTEALQLADTKILQQRFIRMMAELKNGLRLYISCDAALFGSGYSALQGELKGELSKLGSTFVDDVSSSDWAIYIKAKAREYAKNDFGSVTTYFAYVDVQLIIKKTTTGQQIYGNQISQKGGHTHNYIAAAREAYRLIVPEINAIIRQQISQ